MTTETKSKIGILGGTFNPVHLGHLALAGSAIKKFDLSRIIFIPCFSPPHKTAKALALAGDRLAMLKLAIKNNPRFETSDIEIKRGEPSYTIDTIAELKKTNPGAEYYFIIGTDSLLQLYRWKGISKLLKLCKIVTFGRPGVNVRKINPGDLKLSAPWPEQLLRNFTTGRLPDISSSDIRRRVAEKMSIRCLAPKDVAVYIAEHNLYTK